MIKHLVLTLIAEDKPGLVDDLSGVIVKHGGSWQASRMSHLDGMFAGILSISIEESKEEQLVGALESLESQGMKLIIEQTRVEEQKLERFSFSIVANDRAGIINEISHVLREMGANVEELSSDCESAAMSGGHLFKANLVITINDSIQIEDLKEKLEDLSDDLIVDLSF